MGSNIDVSSTGALVNRLMNPPNPMQQLQQTVEGVNALKTFQANQASADAYRQSVDPVTGEVDLGKYKALMSQGPGAWSFGPQTQQAGQAVGAVGTGTSADVKAKQDMLSGISGFLGPIYGDGKSPIPADQAMQMLERARALHIATPEMINNVESQIQQLGPNGDARGLVNGMVFATGAGLEQLHARSSPGYVDTGPGFAQTNPSYSGPAPPYQPKGLSPEQTIGTTSVPIGNGQNAMVPNWVIAAGPAAIEQWLRVAAPGYIPNSYQPPQGGGGGGGGTTTPPGRYPRPPAPAPTPSPTPPPTPTTTEPDWKQPPPPNPAAGGPGITPKPGYGETSKVSTDAANALQAQITQAQDIKPTLSDMESNIRSGATTGVGAQQLSGLRQALINFGITPDKSAGDNPNEASAQAAQEEFNKNSALLQGYQLQSLGRPTDARQELSEQSRPGGGISTQGNLNLIHMLQGNQQAIEVVGNAWAQAQKAGWTPDRFNEWANQHFYTASDADTGGKFNRRVFWMANAPDLKAQQDIFQKLPEGQKTQFRKDLQYAKNQGWIVQKDDGSIAPASP